MMKISDLLSLSENTQSLEEYQQELQNRLNCRFQNMNSIHGLAMPLLRSLGYDRTLIRRSIEIILSTVSQWDDAAHQLHVALLKEFRPHDLAITHAQGVPLAIQQEGEYKFACYYPWGGVYAETLQWFCDTHGISRMEDPRTEGSDCYGMLIAGPNGDVQLAAKKMIELEKMVLQSMENESEFDEDAYWEKVVEARWNLSFDDVNVIDISTDWKHLEIDDHAEQLAKVGIKMSNVWSDVLGVSVISLQYAVPNQDN